MKKLNTITNSMRTSTLESLSKIIDNESINVESLTEDERFAVLIFNELKSSLNTKEYAIILDCNYSKSKNSIALVDYYRLIDKSSNASLIQLYVSCSAKRAECNFRLCTSCAESVQEKLQSLKFSIKRDKRTHRAKTSERRNIAYAEVVSVVKSVLAVLASTEQTSEQTSEQTAEQTE